MGFISLTAILANTIYFSLIIYSYNCMEHEGGDIINQ